MKTLNMYTVGTVLEPIPPFQTGYAVIISVDEMGYVEILTDFGNIFKISGEDIVKEYQPQGFSEAPDGTCVWNEGVDIGERFKMQSEKLQKARERLIELELFEDLESELKQYE